MDGQQQFEEFIAELHNEKTRVANRIRLDKFLEFAEINLDGLVRLSAKDARHLILTTQAKMTEKGIANNSILGYISVVRNFFEFLDKPITRLKGKLVDKQMAKGFHVFGNGDLIEMFNHGDIRGKALLATATSLGWEISSFANMERQLFKDIVEKATSEKQRFIFFMTQRQKTGAPRLAVLNPLAIEWLSKWFKSSKDKPTVFGLGEDQISNIIKKLAKESGIKLTGRIRFHNLRAWTMSSLSKAGFNSFQIKYVMGKSINASDATYLRRLQDEIEEKYPTVYQRYLCIQPEATIVEQKDDYIQNLEATVTNQQKEIGDLKTRLDVLTQDHETMGDSLMQYLDTIEKKYKLRA